MWRRQVGEQHAQLGGSSGVGGDGRARRTPRPGGAVGEVLVERLHGGRAFLRADPQRRRAVPIAHALSLPPVVGRTISGSAHHPGLRAPGAVRPAATASDRARPARPARTPGRRAGRGGRSRAGSPRSPRPGRRTRATTSSGVTWARPNERTPGVSTTQPPRSAGSGSATAAVEVCRPLPIALTTPTARSRVRDERVDQRRLAHAGVPDEHRQPVPQRVAQRRRARGRAR